ncbi:YXWGXW repeat-containing protein [Candidatus Aalborgicola defluviihabitans]|jgi:hypothetical protein|uniref:YXWGXW repeat-containing protein n=1 Tax=Candidatus Aalborgicola defluviihabitans TaxID=3386187 RepID=UPI001D43D46F|nr:YXWGXW repeat-containing protein [Burkholderiales bacterium]MBK6568891.1 YXWGXW repeat-containing protein [Burkholderiales bacterium]MBK7281036.1 YXWGXW repeat-containing protein [Burkholderiales bacterium]MBK7313713.1 YXWGXW repeat-containing protein [Burkholderiales bacterium]MBL0245545.1 YXWGXW repeat-containing protein [Rhodoferax sp.]
MMKFRKTMLAAICVGLLVGIGAPLTATAQVRVYFNNAPPEPRYEVVPAPRRGYVWSAGYWDLRGHRHVWRAGHWERARRGYYMNQPTWTQNGDRWELRRGHWNRGDNDHDGVRNGKDRAPNNPYVQ